MVLTCWAFGTCCRKKLALTAEYKFLSWDSVFPPAISPSNSEECVYRSVLDSVAVVGWINGSLNCGQGEVSQPGLVSFNLISEVVLCPGFAQLILGWIEKRGASRSESWCFVFDVWLLCPLHMSVMSHCSNDRWGETGSGCYSIKGWK